VTPHSPKLSDAKRTGGRPTTVKRIKFKERHIRSISDSNLQEWVVGVIFYKYFKINRQQQMRTQNKQI
jgi:hypothetical protein